MCDTSPQNIPNPSPAGADDHEQSDVSAVEPTNTREATQQTLREMDGGLTVLVVISAVGALYLAKPFLLPIAAALLMSFLLRPMVGVLRRLGLPRFVGAFALLVGGLVLLVSAISLLTPTITQTIADLPETAAIARERIEGISGPVRKTGEVIEQIENMGQADAVDNAEGLERGRDLPVEVSLASNDRMLTMLGVTGSSMLTIMITVILAFFFAASSETILLRAAEVFPGMQKRKRAESTLRELESEISSYLLTLTGINVMVGLAMTGAAWALGVPQPWIMGLMAGLFNYVPYLGAIAAFGLIAISSLVVMPSLSQAVWPPLAFLVINALEAYVIGPMIYGSRLRLNAVAILVSLMFFTWIWGVPGAILAVPMLVSIRVICSHVPRWQSFERLLGPV